MSRSVPWSVSRQARRVRVTMSVLIALAVLLELAAGTGLAIVAGVSRVQQVLAHFDWAWLPVLGGCLGLAFTGYYFAYRGDLVLRRPVRPCVGRRVRLPGAGLLATDAGPARSPARAAQGEHRHARERTSARVKAGRSRLHAASRQDHEEFSPHVDFSASRAEKSTGKEKPSRSCSGYKSDMPHTAHRSALLSLASGRLPLIPVDRSGSMFDRPAGTTCSTPRHRPWYSLRDGS